MLRSFLKDGVIYTIPALVSRGMALLLLPLYTRVLGTGDYGSLELLTVFATIINLTIALEVSQGVARFFGAEPDRERKKAYLSSALWFSLGCYTAFLALCQIFAETLAPWILGQAGKTDAFRIGVTYVWANGLFLLVQNQFRWELRAAAYAAVSMLMTVATALLAVYFTWFLRWGLEGVLLALTLGCLLALGLGLVLQRRGIVARIDGERLREMLAFSWPLVPSGIAVWVSSYVDRVMINHYLTIDDVGLYGLGFRIASVSTLALVGFQGALTPLVYTHYKAASTPAELARIFRYFLMLALGLFLALSLFAADILRLLTTPAFYDAAIVVPLLVPAVLLAQMYVFAPGLAIAKKTHYILWINVAGALLNALLNLLLIPHYGIGGAALATLLGSGAVFALYMIFSQRAYAVPHRWLSLGCAAAGTSLLIAAVHQYAAESSERWLYSLAAIALFLLIMRACGLLRPDELKALLRRTGSEA